MATSSSKTNTSLAIIALICGVLAMLTIFLFKGMLAVLLGIIGISVSAAGISQAKKDKESSGLLFTSLTISIIGTSLALLWFFMIPAVIKPALDRIGDHDDLKEIEDIIIDKVKEKDIIFKKEIEITNDKIQKSKKDLENELEDILIELEEEFGEGKKHIEIHINDSTAAEIKSTAKDALKETFKKILVELGDSIEITIEKEEE